MTLIALALALTAAAAPASDGGSKPKEDRLICRSEANTGTRFAKRICRRQSDLDARERKAQADMQEMQSQPILNPPENSG